MARQARRLVILCGFLIVAALVPCAEAADLPPVLQAAIARPGHPLRDDDGRVLVWVFFADRGRDGAALESALATARRELSPRAAARRGRVRGADREVTVADLPPPPAYMDAARATGARPRRTSSWLNAASFAATADQIRRLAALPSVARLEPVSRYRRRPPALDPAPPLRADKAAAWTLDYGGSLDALEQANVPPVHEMGLSGRDVLVGVLDTGFRTAHDALQLVDVQGAWDFVGDDELVDNEPGDPATARNHGTMVLSTMAGYQPGQLVGPAYGASVLLAKTEDVAQEVRLEEDHWVAGLEWAEAAGADLITSSLGYLDWYVAADLDGDTAVTTIAADAAVARGLVVVNAAGNERATSGLLIAPADGDSVITVGAVDADGGVSSFSSPGPTADGRIKPDVAALGRGACVASPSDDHAYGSVNGTSFATPLTAGVVALMLERAPHLNPIEVRSALRGSASQAGSPDNDLGWGIIDAHAAVTWYGPIWDHTPLGDTEDTTNPLSVSAFITSRAGLDAGTLEVAYRLDGGSWQTTPLVPTGGGPVSYVADLPTQSAGTEVEYYLTGADLEGHVVTAPVRAPARTYDFRVGPDTTPPTVADLPTGNTTLFAWPPRVRCTATDNLGVAGVDLRYRRNGGAEQGPFPMTHAGGGAYELDFPRDAARVSEGDVYSYTLTATDMATASNATVHGPRTFVVNSFATTDTVMTAAGPVSIPDDGFTVASSLIGVTAEQSGTVVGLEVDVALTHPDVGQLTVTLMGPGGSMITLHDRGGGGTADLVGTWPTTLAVSGPGDLGEFLGASNEGYWLLRVTDHEVGDAGTLESWALDFTLTDVPSGTGGDVPAARTRIVGSTPNPFNPTTRIDFELSAAGRTRLSIHDVRGMLVRELLDRDLPAGPHDVLWNGRDGAGRELASGIYLLRLRSGDLGDERKLTLVR